ncbi:MAG: delta-aminolevulinic acid dehydratase [Elusimicrobia bacterium RIFCSPLOWO2_12_FULL_59_9]|nr:MAG: delta-aminolevulinic acid dehydratase [Elusimicrobia bacterium RIFCSPLOWO2_12_FULL_59_9]
MQFPAMRLRRLRASPGFRRLARETNLRPENLIAPLFVRSGSKVKKPIASMPGCFQFSADLLAQEAKTAQRLGIGGVILFGIPDKKDPLGRGAYDSNGVIQRALKAVKDAAPELPVIADLCFCEYTDHGHCGVVKKSSGGGWILDNDATLDLMMKTARSQAEAGADIIAPSAMIDGQVKTIRQALDESGHAMTPILAYAAKFASAFYGPFRDAAESPPGFGDRSSYQMDPANAREALREAALDVEEGADIVMVKPALAYLDLVYQIKRRFKMPTAAYSVSGEYAMLKAAAANGWLDEKKAALESLTSIKRAGADIILTYYAFEAAAWLEKS